jgi:hypothetical protein
MIVVDLTGGLGNQMFQYAAGKYLATRLDTELKLNLNWFESNTKGTSRNFMLDKLCVDFQSINHNEIAQFRPTSLTGKVFLKARKLFGNISFLTEYQLNPYNHEFDTCNKNVYLQGYWQSEKYFLPIRELLIKEFQPKLVSEQAKEYLRKINSSNSLALHVRRGDYVSNQKSNNYHGICEISYYQSAYKLAREKQNIESTFIFSDDIKWCEMNLDFISNTIFIKKCLEEEDIFLMSKCNHHIIANSSFSWWGAWLCENPNQTVIAPEKWFGNVNIDTKDLYPDHWIKL